MVGSLENMLTLPIEIEGRQIRPYWIVHLKDGRTITEKESEWTDLPEKEIQSAQLKLTNQKTITLSRRGRNLAFFQFKESERFVTGSANLEDIITNIKMGVPDTKTVALGICIGAVLNKKGDALFCYVRFSDGQIFFDWDNVLNPRYQMLKLNLDHFKINLKELDD